MKYSVDVEGDGEVSVGVIRGVGNVSLTLMFSEDATDYSFELSPKEFQQLRKAMEYISDDLEGKAE